MPVCRTCRGEYVAEECLCPSCLGRSDRGGTLCHHCGANTRGKRLCPRCKSDVTAWERESFSLVAFMRRWGALGLLPSLAALGLWLAFWLPRGQSLHHPAMLVVSVALSQMVVIALYTTRLIWWERRWASQIYEARSASLPVALTGTFVGGVVLAVLSFVLYKVWEPPVELWQQLVFGAAYVPTFVLLTASLTLLAIQDYVDRLDERVPPPIFVHTERLLRVAVGTALQSLGVLGSTSAASAAPGGEDGRQEVLEAVRVSEDGGIHVLLRVTQSAPGVGGGSSTGEQRAENLWRIEADRWGRVRSVKPGAQSAVRASR